MLPPPTFMVPLNVGVSKVGELVGASPLVTLEDTRPLVMEAMLVLVTTP